MLECELLKDKGRVVINENGEEVLQAKLILDDGMALLDDIEFSDKKIEEVSSGNVLLSSIAFLRNVEDCVIRRADEIGLDINLVTFGDFASVKKLDTIANAFGLDYSRETKKSSMR